MPGIKLKQEGTCTCQQVIRCFCKRSTGAVAASQVGSCLLTRAGKALARFLCLCTATAACMTACRARAPPNPLRKASPAVHLRDWLLRALLDRFLCPTIRLLNHMCCQAAGESILRLGSLSTQACITLQCETSTSVQHSSAPARRTFTRGPLAYKDLTESHFWCVCTTSRSVFMRALMRGGL